MLLRVTAASLLELPEQTVHGVGVNACAGVLNFEGQKTHFPFGTIMARHFDQHMPLRGEFDGIADEVEQHLPDSTFVT